MSRNLHSRWLWKTTQFGPPFSPWLTLYSTSSLRGPSSILLSSIQIILPLPSFLRKLAAQCEVKLILCCTLTYKLQMNFLDRCRHMHILRSSGQPSACFWSSTHKLVTRHLCQRWQSSSRDRTFHGNRPNVHVGRFPLLLDTSTAPHSNAVQSCPQGSPSVFQSRPIFWPFDALDRVSHLLLCR